MIDTICKEILARLDSLHDKVDNIDIKLESHISAHQAQSKVWKTIASAIGVLVGLGGLVIACIK